MVKEEMMILQLLQLINQSLRENDKVKENVLAGSFVKSIISLSERIQQLERKQIR